MSLSTDDAITAPRADPPNAKGAYRKAVRAAGTRRAMVIAELPVPQIAAILFTPSACEYVKLGFRIMMSGRRMSPPPPTTASTHPAKREAASMRAITVGDMRKSYRFPYWFSLIATAIH